MDRIGLVFPELLAAAQAGHEWAWDRLVRSYGPAVLGYARSQGMAEPEELLGDVLVELVKGLRAFSGDEGNFRSWIFVIAHNRVVDARRRAGRRPTAEWPDGYEPATTRARDPCRTTSVTCGGASTRCPSCSGTCCCCAPSSASASTRRRTRSAGPWAACAWPTTGRCRSCVSRFRRRCNAMTPTNGDESEMNENPGHVPEPLLPGEQPWLEQFAASFARPEDADVASQLGASVFAAHLTTEKGDLAATSASKADGPSQKASGLPKWRTRMVVFGASALSTVVGKVAVAAASVAVVAGGVAAADALASQPSGPDEVVVTSQQDDSADTDEVVEVDAVEVDDTGDDTTDPVITDDDQGEDGDHQGAGGASDDGQGEDADDQGDDSQGDGGEDADDQGDDDQGEDVGDRGGSRDDDSDDADEDRSGSRDSDDADDDSDEHSAQDDSDSDVEDAESDD